MLALCCLGGPLTSPHLSLFVSPGLKGEGTTWALFQFHRGAWRVGYLNAVLSRPLALELYPLISDVNSALTCWRFRSKRDPRIWMWLLCLFVLTELDGPYLASLYDLQAQSWES